jgi:hypothetical protein
MGTQVVRAKANMPVQQGFISLCIFSNVTNIPLEL